MGFRRKPSNLSTALSQTLSSLSYQSCMFDLVFYYIISYYIIYHITYIILYICIIYIWLRVKSWGTDFDYFQYQFSLINNQFWVTYFWSILIFTEIQI
jgi:hypothetical protein